MQFGLNVILCWVTLVILLSNAWSHMSTAEEILALMGIISTLFVHSALKKEACDAQYVHGYTEGERAGYKAKLLKEKNKSTEGELHAMLWLDKKKLTFDKRLETRGLERKISIDEALSTATEALVDIATGEEEEAAMKALHALKTMYKEV